MSHMNDYSPYFHDVVEADLAGRRRAACTHRLHRLLRRPPRA